MKNKVQLKGASMHDEKTTSTIIPAAPVDRWFAARRERESGQNEMFAQEAAFAPFPGRGWVSGFLQAPQ